MSLGPNVTLFADGVLRLRGEETAMTVDACRLVSGQTGLFTRPRPNPSCLARINRERYPGAQSSPPPCGG